MSRGLPRGLRLAGAALVACASVPVLSAPPAYADTAQKAPVNAGYFNRAGIDKPDASPADPPNLTSDHLDGVSAGHLAVAGQGGTEDKVSFLLFDVFDLTGATVDRAVLRVVLVPSDPPNDLVYNNTPEAVRACKAGSEGFAGDDGNGIALAPSRLCDEFEAPGKASADGKAYEFDVTKLVQEWVDGVNDGVALTVASDATTNFQVVFDTAETAGLAVSYTPAVDTTVPPVLPPAPAVGTPDLGSGFAPTPGTGFVPPSAPEVVPPAVPNPTVNQPPVAAPQPAAVPVAVSTSMRPTSAFWLMGLLLAAGLALLSLIFGDPRVPSAQRSRSRLTQALSSRQGLATAKAGFRTVPA